MKLPAGIKKVTRVKGLGRTPAKCYRDTGEVLINADVWDKLHPDHQYFILCHEAGHIARNTRDEFEADEYAFQEYVKSGRGLTNSVLALSKVLTFPEDNELQRMEHELRTQAQFERAMNYDYKVNGNQKANLNQINMCNYNPVLAQEIEDHFLGKLFGRNKNSNPNQMKDARANKKEAKADAIRDKAEARKLKAMAELELAKQGIATGIAGLGQGLGQTGMLSGRLSGEDTTTTEEPKFLGIFKSKTTGWIVIGVVGALIVGTVIYFVTKR